MHSGRCQIKRKGSFSLCSAAASVFYRIIHHFLKRGTCHRVPYFRYSVNDDLI